MAVPSLQRPGQAAYGLFHHRISAKGAHSGAREEKGLENGSRWRVVVAGEWNSLENGRRWRMAGAGEGKGKAANSGSCPNIDSVTDLFPRVRRS